MRRFLLILILLLLLIVAAFATSGVLPGAGPPGAGPPGGLALTGAPDAAGARPPMTSHPTPYGLYLGTNMCYANSLIQCLMSLSEPFKRQVDKVISTDDNLSNLVTSAFQGNGRQQDPEELLLALRVKSETEMGEFWASLKDLFYRARFSERTLYCIANEWKLQTEVPYYTLAVAIPTEIKLGEDGFADNFTKADGTRAKREYAFNDLLIIRLQRFARDLSKNITRVNYSPTLYVGTDDGPVRYSLQAVCVHLGSFNRGHYIAYCKRGPQWYTFDDSNVHSMDEDKVVDNDVHSPTKNAYMLFYAKS